MGGSGMHEALELEAESEAGCAIRSGETPQDVSGFIWRDLIALTSH